MTAQTAGLSPPTRSGGSKVYGALSPREAARPSFKARSCSPPSGRSAITSSRPPIPSARSSPRSTIGWRSRARSAKNVLLNDVDFLAASIGRGAMARSAPLEHGQDSLPTGAYAAPRAVAARHGPRRRPAYSPSASSSISTTRSGAASSATTASKASRSANSTRAKPSSAFRSSFAELKRRGIILAVVSKNEHANAILPFKEHPFMVLKEEDISVFVANWDNKADNIRLVQKTLNIGFDSFVFLDDNPFERNIVREYVPDVVVPELPEDPSSYLETLAEPQFVRDGLLLRGRPAASRAVSGRGAAGDHQDPVRQRQRLSQVARHADQARAVQRLQSSAHRPADPAQQPVQPDDPPLWRGRLRGDDEGRGGRAAHAEAFRTSSATTG